MSSCSYFTCYTLLLSEAVNEQVHTVTVMPTPSTMSQAPLIPLPSTQTSTLPTTGVVPTSKYPTSVADGHTKSAVLISAGTTVTVVVLAVSAVLMALLIVFMCKKTSEKTLHDNEMKYVAPFMGGGAAALISSPVRSTDPLSLVQ